MTGRAPAAGKLLFSRSRQAAANLRRRLFPSRAEAAWRKVARDAWRVPRYTSGTYELMGLRLDYVDLLTIAPQWKDTFVDEVHAFTTPLESPRIIDCGANVGVVTLYYKSRYPRARITAFEADPAIASALAKNVEQNWAPDVEVIAAAVWDENGETTFAAEGSDAGSVSTEYHGHSRKLITVTTLRFRDFIAKEDQIDLLKLDIEGAEHRVLADSESELHRVRAIVAELHEFDPQSRRNPATLDLLTRAGFRYAHLGIIPLPDAGEQTGPFPSPKTRWVERIYAWRE